MIKRRHAFKLLWLIPIALVALLYLDYLVVSKFSGQKWRLPSHVYARPLELYVGAELDIADVQQELVALGYRPGLRDSDSSDETTSGRYDFYSGRIDLRTRGFEFWDMEEPSQAVSVEFSEKVVSRLVSENGDDLPIVRLEPQRIGGIYPDHLEDRRAVRLDGVPDLLVETLLAVEDRDFFSHRGISIRGILRALRADIRAGSLVEGGSTITQQLVKNFYLTNDRTFSRKFREVLMAPMLELHFSKEEILETYLNEVYFGQSGQRSIRGVGLASHYYFGQPLGELDVHQIALIVGIIKGPSYYQPWIRSERALERRNLVLNVMQERGLLTEQEAAGFKNRELDLWQRPARALNPYPAYMKLVRSQLEESYDADELASSGMQIFTHLDPIIQRRLESVAQEDLASIESEYGLDADTLQVGAVLSRIGSGEIVAMIGGREPGFDGFNRALDARRAIGSLIKPLIYLHALKEPEVSLASLVSDQSFSVPAPDDEVWTPENYDRESHGDVILLDALIYSYNQAAAKIGLEMGVEEVLNTVSEFTSAADWKPYPATLLGSGALTVAEVSEIYQVFANDGFQVSANTIDTVYDDQLEPLIRFEESRNQIIESGHAHIMQYALQMVMLEGTGRSAFRWLNDDRSVAGKTGTTNEQRDSWFAGFGGDYMGVFWVGRDDNEPTPLTGASGAMRLWAKTMSEVEQRPLNFVRPESVEYHWVDRTTGKLSLQTCADSIMLPFLDETVPTEKDVCARRVGPRVLNWFREVLESSR